MKVVAGKGSKVDAWLLGKISWGENGIVAVVVVVSVDDWK